MRLNTRALWACFALAMLVLTLPAIAQTDVTTSTSTIVAASTSGSTFPAHTRAATLALHARIRAICAKCRRGKRDPISYRQEGPKV